MADKVKLTPDEVSEKWNRRLKGSISDIQNGIAKVTTSPAQLAIAKKDKMKANLMKSLEDGTWEKRLGAVTLDDWKAKTIAKVGERMSGGVDAAMPKRQKFDKWLVAKVNDVLPRISKMPDLTMEDSVNRVRAFMEHMSKSPYKKG